MENVRNHLNIRLCSNDQQFKRQVAKPEFKRFKIFNDDLTGVHLHVSDLELNKPIFVGFSILDISKMLMYQYHYGYMLPKYPSAKVLFSDTDSLCYHVKTENIYKDMLDDSDHFDTSDYPKEHFLHSTTNKKVLGKMKDETAGVAISEFVGLRSKMYSILYNGQEKKTAKGIGRSSIRKMRHDHYKQVLMEGTRTMATSNMIRSYAHKIFSERITKVALSAFDDKRYVLEDGCNTLAHGHHNTQQRQVPMNTVTNKDNI